MHLLLIGLAILAALVIILLIVVSLRPNEFHVERKRHHRRAAPRRLPLINDFHEWGQWSPWDQDGSGDETHLFGRVLGGRPRYTHGWATETWVRAA